jgi:hypothetical protein
MKNINGLCSVYILELVDNEGADFSKEIKNDIVIPKSRRYIFKYAGTYNECMSYITQGYLERKEIN